MKIQLFKLSNRIAARLGATVLAAFCLFSSAAAEEALAAVAANFKDAADALKADFEARTGHALNVTAGSTGKLYAQIVNGAPYDVFLAADEARPRLLEENGAAVAGSRFTYAVGRLALWSPDDSRFAGADGATVLREGDFRRLAIANPDLAPYGAAARDVLQALTRWDDLQAKIVMGENVTQSFTYAATGNAEFGFVALSSVVSLGDGAGAYWAPPAALYAPIRQDAVLLKRAESNEAARAFIDYLKSDDARALIAGLGYRAE